MSKQSALADFEAARARYQRIVNAADPPVPGGGGAGGAAVLWKYEDPDGKTFYLEEKRTTVKSPFTGKSFPAKPKRHTPAQVGRELKDKTASLDVDFEW